MCPTMKATIPIAIIAKGYWLNEKGILFLFIILLGINASFATALSLAYGYKDWWLSIEKIEQIPPGGKSIQRDRKNWSSGELVEWSSGRVGAAFSREKHRTSNVECEKMKKQSLKTPEPLFLIGCLFFYSMLGCWNNLRSKATSLFDVGRSMFDVGRSFF